jgi:hypothetical protein
MSVLKKKGRKKERERKNAMNKGDKGGRTVNMR